MPMGDAHNFRLMYFVSRTKFSLEMLERRRLPKIADKWLRI